MNAPQRDAPTGVRLELDDGTVLDCEPRLIGVDGDGIRRWRLIHEPLDGRRIRALHAECLPAQTGLVVDGLPGSWVAGA